MHSRNKLQPARHHAPHQPDGWIDEYWLSPLKWMVACATNRLVGVAATLLYGAAVACCGCCCQLLKGVKTIAPNQAVQAHRSEAKVRLSFLDFIWVQIT